MKKNRDQRYSSAAELLEDLQAVARGEPPVRARRKFDLAALANLETKAQNTALVEQDNTDPLLAQPILWIAVTGWILAGVLLILLLNAAH